MELQSMERQRIRRYKQYLKQQAEKSIKQRKQQNTYQRKKQLVNMNELIQKLNQDDIRRLQQRKYTARLLKQHNNTLSSIKKNIVHEQQQEPSIKNNSFIDQINSKDNQRISKGKQKYSRFTQENQVQQQIRRDAEQRNKFYDRQQEERHLKRLKQMQAESQKNYEHIKRKHDQNMKLYDMHSQLMQQNEQYRKMAEKFTETQEDIISKLKRKNQSAERKRVYKYNQQVLKNQMGQYQQRKSMQKSQILQGQNIDESIFRNLMHGSPNYKKQLGQQLRYQISEMESRKIQQKQGLKQKYRISGIYGGQHGRQRQAQIQYIDRKMGLHPKINHPQSINNQQEYRRANSSMEQSKNAMEYKSLPSIQPVTNQKMLTKQVRNMKRQPVTSMIISNSKDQISSNNNKIVRNSPTPFPAVDKTGQAQNNQYVYLNGQNSPDRKLFLSYDVVTGKNRFYG